MNKQKFMIGLSALALLAYGCSSSDDPSPEPDGSSSSSSSSSSGDTDADVSSSGGSSSGSSSSTSSSSSSSGNVVEDASMADASEGGSPQECLAIVPTQWLNTNCSPATCASVFESEFTPKIDGTFIDFVRFVFDAEATELNTDYEFSMQLAVWQRDMRALVGNSEADARHFKAESGTLNVSSFNSETKSVSATLTDVKLVELMPGDGPPVKMPGGMCLTLSSAVVVQN